METTANNCVYSTKCQSDINTDTSKVSSPTDFLKKLVVAPFKAFLWIITPLANAVCVIFQCVVKGNTEALTKTGQKNETTTDLASLLMEFDVESSKNIEHETAKQSANQKQEGKIQADLASILLESSIESNDDIEHSDKDISFSICPQDIIKLMIDCRYDEYLCRGICYGSTLTSALYCVNGLGEDFLKQLKNCLKYKKDPTLDKSESQGFFDLISVGQKPINGDKQSIVSFNSALKSHGGHQLKEHLDMIAAYDLTELASFLEAIKIKNPKTPFSAVINWSDHAINIGYDGNKWLINDVGMGCYTNDVLKGLKKVYGHVVTMNQHSSIDKTAVINVPGLMKLNFMTTVTVVSSDKSDLDIDDACLQTLTPLEKRFENYLHKEQCRAFLQDLLSLLKLQSEHEDDKSELHFDTKAILSIFNQVIESDMSDEKKIQILSLEKKHGGRSKSSMPRDLFTLISSKFTSAHRREHVFDLLLEYTDMVLKSSKLSDETKVALLRADLFLFQLVYYVIGKNELETEQSKMETTQRLPYIYFNKLYSSDLGEKFRKEFSKYDEKIGLPKNYVSILNLSSNNSKTGTS